MPRIRTLKPEHKQHRKVGPLSDFCYRLWVGCVTEADDAGRLVADPAQLRVLIFGYHPKVTSATVQAGLTVLHQAHLVRLYVLAGVQYAEMHSFSDHQVINKPSPSKLPEYKDSGSTTVVLPEQYGSTTDGSRIKDQGSEGSRIKERIKDVSLTANSVALTNGIVFHIPASVSEALKRAPVLGQVARFRDPSWWQAQLRANPGVDLGGEVLKAEAWMQSNPLRAPRKAYERFLHTWLARADRSA